MLVQKFIYKKEGTSKHYLLDARDLADFHRLTGDLGYSVEKAFSRIIGSDDLTGISDIVLIVAYMDQATDINWIGLKHGG